MMSGVIGNGLINNRFIRFETDSGTALDPAFITGGSAAFEWISPDGSISTGAIPSPSLDQAGKYVVKCTDWSDVTVLDYAISRIISLSNLHVLTSLTELLCSVNKISVLDVSALTSLVILRCSGNSISILDIAALTVLEVLNCDSNSISSLDVSTLTVLTEFTCTNNGMDETNVDKILADLVIAGANNGLVNIGGTNAAPSAAGDASKTILVGRGWTVITS